MLPAANTDTENAADRPDMLGNHGYVDVDTSSNSTRTDRIDGTTTSAIHAAVIPTPQQKIQRLKDELCKTQGQLAEATTQLEAHTRELKRTQGEKRQMAQQIDGLERERQCLKEADRTRKDELAIIRRELGDAKNLAETRGKELDSLKAKEADQSHESELSIVRRELEATENLASIRGKWLQGAEVFLTTADAISISEVVEKVTNLNEEIFQAAALLGDVMVYKPHDVSQEQMSCALIIAQGMIGSKLIHILCEQSPKKVPEANALIVQVVVQVFLVTYCSHLVHSWSDDTNYQSYLSAVYSRIRDDQEQAVSGRWRALTRSYTRPTPEGWKEDLLQKLGSVLRVASWMTLDVQQGNAFERKLESIFRAVEDLRNALGEKFISADLEVSVIEADQVFQPAYMEDAYGDPVGKSAGKDAPQEVVVGTTGIGLKKAMLKRSMKGEVLYESVLSAKVALEFTLLEALNPSPPKKTRKKKLVKSVEKEVLSPPA